MGVLFALSAVVAVAAPDEQVGSEKQATVIVRFAQPERFTDVGDRDVPSPRVRDLYLDELRKHVERRAAPRLAGSITLTVTVTDVDMAGAFELWRRQAVDVRVVREVYPPRINLRFVLADASGVTLREGSRDLRDPAFLLRPIPYPRDPLRFEKALLDEWIDQEFGTAAKASG